MSGQRQKHPDKLAYKGSGRYQPLTVVAASHADPPALPDSASATVQQVWRDLWASDLAGAFKPTDVPTLKRWAWWFDQWLRVSGEIEADPLLTQARGVWSLNPKVRYLKQCESSLRELEKAFGLDPLARLRLGITLADGQAKAQALREPVKPRAM
jgi:P27 family predicted phage terminase small subunit